MKRFLSILLIVLTIATLCGCATRTRVNENAEVKLIYKFNDKDIEVVLSENEAEKVKKILSGKSYNHGGIPSCGFSKDISVKVGMRTFAIARDKCNIFQDMGNLKFFSVSQEDIEYIRSLFEEQGGHFPCI